MENLLVLQDGQSCRTTRKSNRGLNLSKNFAVLDVDKLPDFRGRALLITRILIFFMTLWLPIQNTAAASMTLCQQMPQVDSSVASQAAGIPNCNQTNPGMLQSCTLCHACIVCPMPTLGADHTMLSLFPPFSFEPVALWQPYVRVLDVLEHPPRPFLPLSG